MAADNRHLRERQPKLKKTAYGLVPEVVEPEVFQLCSL